jgi:uncharacterized OsmC-like protein
VGTFGGALEARGIQASAGTLSADAEGDVESDKGVLVLRRIRVHYRLVVSSEAAETVERVHAIHKEHCPVYRSIHTAVEVTTSVRLEPPPPAMTRR